MEEDIHYQDSSHHRVEKTAAKIEERLEKAIHKAQETIDYESAHNEELLRALSIVAEFIRRRKRVCYGGTAMNAILPPPMKFYDPEHDLPDYDFYTPDAVNDVAELVEDLKAAGFKDVYHKVGMHEGTRKILVNFSPVADISSIDETTFNVFYKRSILKDGIHYTDPDILRMMMYLELSRPRGEVSRWNKVFERLQLVNRAFPIKGCGGGGAPAPFIQHAVHRIILDHVIENQRVLCNGPLRQIYSQGIRKGAVKYKVEKGGSAILFVSPDPRADAVAIKAALQSSTAGAKDVRLFLHKARGEIVPQRIELRVGNRIVCLIVQEVACHSANPVPTDDGRFVQVASPEFLVTLYLSLDIFTAHSRDILGHRALCDVKEVIQLAQENYKAKRSAFPPFSLGCKGYQAGFASLLREKVKRVQREKGGAEQSKTKKVRRSGKAGEKKKKGTRRSRSVSAKQK
jgi:hypothetical protein